MANAMKDQGTTEIPGTFPPGTLFVAVSDDMRAVAGDDGGPLHGGKGRWRVGDVGPWTSDRAVPLAVRDPDDGMIWKGYLEEVLRVGPDGKCAESRPIFGLQEEEAVQRTAKRATVAKRQPRSSAPSAKAVARAAHGPADLSVALQPPGQQDATRRRMAERSGVNAG